MSFKYELDGIAISVYLPGELYDDPVRQSREHKRLTDLVADELVKASKKAKKIRKIAGEKVRVTGLHMIGLREINHVSVRYNMNGEIKENAYSIHEFYKL